MFYFFVFFCNESSLVQSRPKPPPGPSDTRVHWLINGHGMDTPIMEYRLQLGQGEVLVSSWVKAGPLIKDAGYSCVAEAGAASDMSEVELRLPIGGEGGGGCALVLVGVVECTGNHWE